MIEMKSPDRGMKPTESRMELSVKMVIFCVIFAHVFGEEKHHHHPSSTEKPLNLAEHKEDRAARLRKYLVDCTEETKVNPDIILKLRSGKWRQALRKEPPSLKKWSLCLLVKADMMSPDGVLKQDVVLSYIPTKDRAKVEKVIDKCLYRKSHGPADIAWHYVTCFRSRFSKYSII